MNPCFSKAFLPSLAILLIISCTKKDTVSPGFTNDSQSLESLILADQPDNVSLAKLGSFTGTEARKVYEAAIQKPDAFEYKSPQFAAGEEDGPDPCCGVVSLAYDPNTLDGQLTLVVKSGDPSYAEAAVTVKFIDLFTGNLAHGGLGVITNFNCEDVSTFLFPALHQSLCRRPYLMEVVYYKKLDPFENSFEICEKKYYLFLPYNNCTEGTSYPVGFNQLQAPISDFYGADGCCSLYFANYYPTVDDGTMVFYYYLPTVAPNQVLYTNFSINVALSEIPSGTVYTLYNGLLPATMNNYPACAGLQRLVLTKVNKYCDTNYNVRFRVETLVNGQPAPQICTINGAAYNFPLSDGEDCD